MKANLIPLSLFLFLPEIQAEAGIHADPRIVLNGETVTFTMSALPKEEVKDGATCRWYLDDVIQSREKSHVFQHVFPAGGIYSIRCEYLDSQTSAIQHCATLYFTVVELKDIEGPDAVYPDSESLLRATFSTTGIPSGGEYSWSLVDGQAGVTFEPVDGATTIATFDKPNNHKIRVRYWITQTPSVDAQDPSSGGSSDNE